MSNMSHITLERSDGIQELTVDEADGVAGGPLPVLGLAVLATTVQFSFIRGVFSGVRKKEERRAAE